MSQQLHALPKGAMCCSLLVKVMELGRANLPMHCLRAALAISLVLTFAAPALAETLLGRVVAVHDGDTITVLVNRHEVKVRLAEIDAPESKQPYGARSKQSLSALCFNRDAQVDVVDQDRYKRSIGRVTCAGVEANAEQVRQGMAWVFDRYAKKGSILYSFQDEARAAKRGLWSDPKPVPPWEWRQANR